jgi:hypothetical protein
MYIYVCICVCRVRFRSWPSPALLTSWLPAFQASDLSCRQQHRLALDLSFVRLHIAVEIAAAMCLTANQQAFLLHSRDHAGGCAEWPNFKNILSTSKAFHSYLDRTTQHLTVMDPLSALSVAGTVVQFVDFCFKLFSHSKELYQSATGRLTADEELVLVTTDLKAVVIRIQRAAFPNQSDTSRCPEGEEEAHQNTLGQICDDTSKVASELLAKLDKLKLDASDRKYRRWKTLSQAVNTLWSKEEIDGLRTRLSTLKQALQTRMLFAIL